jgi:hypothetical protein
MKASERMYPLRTGSGQRRGRTTDEVKWRTVVVTVTSLLLQLLFSLFKLPVKVKTLSFLFLISVALLPVYLRCVLLLKIILHSIIAIVEL